MHKDFNMRKRWLLIPLVLFILIGCETDSSRNQHLISFAPENASILIRTTSIEGLKSVFKNNGLLKDILGYKSVERVIPQINYLEFLKPNETLLMTFGKSATDSLQVSLITTYHKDLLKLDSVANHSIETYVSNDLTVSKITIENSIVYSAVKDSIFFASNDKALTESAFDEDAVVDETLKSLYDTANTETNVSILINTKHNTLVPSFFLTDSLNKSQFSNYYIFDADLSQDQLVFNGITKATDSSKSLVTVFKNTVPQEHTISKLCPTDVDGFLSFTYNNYKTFNSNLSEFRKEAIAPSPIFDTATELGVIYKDGNEAIILNSLDAVALGDLLLTQNSIETYREVDIYPYDNPELFATSFAPFITYTKATRYANLDNYFVFTDSDVLMKAIISDFQNASTLSETAAFKSMMEQLSDESSLLTYGNSARLNELLNTNFAEDLVLTDANSMSSAIQFIQDSDFAHVNAIIKHYKGRSTSNSVSEDISIVLEDDLMTDPQFVDNHTNNQLELVVQDIKNNLYLISNDGKVLWKKQLEGKLLGKVKQIDMFKNGRLQLAFATSNRVYVLDRDGKDVSPFPLKFNDQITQPLSVFDYDNKRDYRLMVIQGKSVLMYDKLGKIVTGFTYKKADNTINTQPEHFRIGKKDYIVFVQGNELEIIDRVGKTRITVKNNISFSDNPIYLYNNQFTATTKTGDLIQIDTNGKMSSMNLKLGEKHAMTSTNKTLVTLSDNILTIKSNKIEMDYGVYTTPKIFYLNDKIYVSLTDLQTNKVYLFDSLGKSINNFPVFGNSSIELDNIDGSRGLEFVTKGDSNSILIYQMN